MIAIARRAAAGSVLCAAALLVVVAGASADRNRDHDEARRAVERGDALPLADLLARLRTRLGGEVIGVSFKKRDDRWVYEFKVIAADGKLSEVYVDAASAEILRRKDR